MSEFDGQVTDLGDGWTLKEWPYDSNPPQLDRSRSFRPSRSAVSVSFNDGGDLEIDELEDFTNAVRVPAQCIGALIAANARYRERKGLK